MATGSRTESGRAPDRKRSRPRPGPVRNKSHGSTYALDREALGRTIGAMFRSARQAQRLSQHQVAALAGHPPVSRTTISSIEGGRMPTVEALVSLSNVLHVNPLEVLERVGLASAAPVDLTGIAHDELRQRAEQLFWTGDYRGALSVYDAMDQRLVLDPPGEPEQARRMKARVEINRAVTLRQCSALQASEASAKRAVELAKGVPALQAEAFMVLASLYSHQEMPELAAAAAERAVRFCRDGEATLQGQVWNQMGNVLTRAGRFEEARKAFLEARKLAIRARDHHLRVKTEGNVGSCLLALGRRAQAKDRFRKAVELARKYDDPAAEAFWLIELGRVAFLDGALEDADRLLEAALRIAKPADRVLTIFRAEWLRHKVTKQRSPRSEDRHRIAYLKKLYVRVREHSGIDVIREFREAVLEAEGGRQGKSS